MVLRDGEVREQYRQPDEQACKEHQIVENLVPQALTERIQCNNTDRSHISATSR